MPSTHDNEDHGATMQPRGPGHARDDRACDDAQPLPLGRSRRELSDGPTLFCPGAPVGHAVLGVLAAAPLPG